MVAAKHINGDCTETHIYELCTLVSGYNLSACVAYDELLKLLLSLYSNDRSNGTELTLHFYLCYCDIFLFIEILTLDIFVVFLYWCDLVRLILFGDYNINSRDSAKVDSLAIE